MFRSFLFCAVLLAAGCPADLPGLAPSGHADGSFGPDMALALVGEPCPPPYNGVGCHGASCINGLCACAKVMDGDPCPNGWEGGCCPSGICRDGRCAPRVDMAQTVPDMSQSAPDLMVELDFSVAADFSEPRGEEVIYDLSEPLDFSVLSDFSVVPDLTTPPDLRKPPKDLTVFPDLVTPPDFREERGQLVEYDLAELPDLAAPPDLAPLIDLCIPHCGGGCQ